MIRRFLSNMARNPIVLISLVLFIPAGWADAETEVLAHYIPGEKGAVTFAAAPDTLEDKSGNGHDLIKEGNPLFFAAAPRREGRSGAMSLLFNGETDWYSLDRALGSAADDFVLEAWARARRGDHPGLHGVASHGDGALGYTLAQQGDRWVAFVGGVGGTAMAPVAEGKWIHLAMAADKDSCRLFVNGRETGRFSRSPGLHPRFTVGDMGHGKEAFHGEIHEVRLSTFTKGGFDPGSDLLLDYGSIRKEKAREAKRRSALIDDLIRKRPGVKVVDDLAVKPADRDWLVAAVPRPVELLIKINREAATASLSLTNGLICRDFFLSENMACTGLRNLRNGAQFIRAVKPEARLELDGRWYDVGGLSGQPEKSYLLEKWLPRLTASPDAFRLEGIETGKPEPRYPWKRKFHAVKTDWPPRGLHLTLRYRLPESRDTPHAGVTVNVHYEMYEGLPVVVKWLTLSNGSKRPLMVDRTECEILAVAQDQIDRLHVESDFSFGLVNASRSGSALLHFTEVPKPYLAGRSTTLWSVDDEYDTWATHNPAEDLFLNFPHRCLMTSRLPMGPAELVEAGGAFQSFLTFELLHDSDDKERRTLGQRRLYRKLSPQVTENLVTAGITSHDPAQLKAFIDQMAECGFERLDIQAWPGVSHDNLDPEYVAHWKEIAAYARDRGIVMGGYELLVASRGRGAEFDCIHPDTGRPGSVFGQSVCIASRWKDVYFPRMWQFFDATGFMSLNADGPYHGDPCASTEHLHHRGLEDSQWRQWKIQVEVIHELQRRNMYVPLPDWYFLNGQCATGMGYREASANLSREQQLLLGRQYIYDGTWHKIPPMGWIGVQLVGFYTSDPRVGLEPLSENLHWYERGLVQTLGSGAQTTVRGNRLHDCPDTRAMVAQWIGWYKTYRRILTSDIIHLGRPTGRDLDCMLHVNADLDTRGLAVLFNPTDRKIEKELVLPLYYTGLTRTAKIREKEGRAKEFHLERDYTVRYPVEVDAHGFTWLVIE